MNLDIMTWQVHPGFFGDVSSASNSVWVLCVDGVHGTNGSHGFGYGPLAFDRVDSTNGYHTLKMGPRAAIANEVFTISICYY